MLKKVLILSNGKSLLNYQDFIFNWSSKLWVCNTLDDETLKTLSLDKITKLRKHNLSEFDLIEKALKENNKEIYLCGFDISGKSLKDDVLYKPYLNKWKSFWQRINKEYGTDNIKFLGYDHKKNSIESEYSNFDTYENNYIDYWQCKEKINKKNTEKNLIIIGKGDLDKKSLDYLKNINFEIWGVNGTFLHHKNLPNIDRIGVVREDLVKRAIQYKKDNKLKYKIYSNTNLNNDVELFSDPIGWGSGILLIRQALIEKYGRIFLLGFDFVTDDLYNPENNYGGNFTIQFTELLKDYDTSNINYIGNSKNLFKDLSINVLNDISEIESNSIVLEEKLGKNLEDIDIIPKEKIALFLSLSDDYMIGFKVFIKSLLKYNPWVKELDLIIMDLGLSKDNKKLCDSLHPKVKYIKPNYNNYTQAKTDRFMKSYFVKNLYKLDIFSYEYYDKIISFDIDMLVTGDISEVIYNKVNFGAVANYNDTNDCLNKTINGGLIVIDKKYINSETYHDLLNLMNTYSFKMAEQGILNKYFMGKVTYLPVAYNYVKRIIKSKNNSSNTKLEDVKIVHYVGYKPWEKMEKDQDYINLEKLWWDCYNE